MNAEIVCLCGSTRFKKVFAEENFRLTLAGKIVLTIGCDTKSDSELKITPLQKAKLDILHFKKIELADTVRILNVDGYIGESTMRELLYAVELEKDLEFYDNSKIPQEFHDGQAG